MDTAARIAAGARARGPVRTVSVLNLDYVQPPQHDDVVCIYTSITRMGRTSITVGVTAEALRCFQAHRVRLMTADYVTVALDDSGLPRMLSAS
jgi:acyl-CoA thioesterase YciA